MTLDDIWQSLREGFFMFWETLWPLILGFTLSGAVQAFAPREQMERVMGDHRPRAVARASGLGMVSSSCSYAATAMGKSLFQKGADFVTAMIFMFASTNLVIELGIVLIVLMGWQFAAAEFVGGPIMIVLLAAHRLLGDQGQARGTGSTPTRNRAWSAATTTTPWSVSATNARNNWNTRPGRSSSAHAGRGPTPRATPSPTSRCCAANWSSVTASPGS